MKKVKIWIFGQIFFFIIGIFGISSMAWWYSYPLSQVSKTSCRFQQRELLDSDCKQELPKISGADYTKFVHNIEYLSIYSVLRWATYDGRRDQGKGSHPGVDIVTSIGTSVRSIASWEVVFAGTNGGRWLVIAIQHSDVISVYAHLDSTNVKKWDLVNEWDQIWRVWDSWNSTAPHLHFQIERLSASKHPFWYFGSCAVGDESSIVNNWLCRDQLLTYTIDPIEFLETNGTWLYSYTFGDKTRYDSLDIADIISTQQIQKYESDQVAKKLNFEFHLNLPYVYTDGSTRLTISTNIQRNLNLSKNITIKSSNPNISIFPNTINNIWTGREIIIMPIQSTESTNLQVYFGDQKIREKTVKVRKNNFQSFVWAYSTSLNTDALTASYIDNTKNTTDLNSGSDSFLWSSDISSIQPQYSTYESYVRQNCAVPSSEIISCQTSAKWEYKICKINFLDKDSNQIKTCIYRPITVHSNTDLWLALPYTKFDLLKLYKTKRPIASCHTRSITRNVWDYENTSQIYFLIKNQKWIEDKLKFR